MAKKDKKSKDAKKARMALKNEKNSKKAEKTMKKQSKKAGDDVEDDVDIDELLKQLALEQEKYEKIHITTVEKPTKRTSSTLVSAPSAHKKELFLFGGEFTTLSGTVNFYNDLHVYSPDSDTWRRYLSKNAPLARSSHSMCYHPSGILVMHGGEFSSPKQSTFHHYSDTWILDTETKEWGKIDSKKGPSGRSGSRMSIWKNYVILFGGFRDLGTHTTYLNDAWCFDITTYKWEEIIFPTTCTLPDPRSGHSFINFDDGCIAYGGYTKVKAGKGLQKGKILNDLWVLKMKSDLKQVRWERKRKQGWQPTPRAGCSMQVHKGRGMLFGGVHDFDETEETLSSEFFNSLLSYNIETNRWFNLKLRSRKKKAIIRKEKNNRNKELEDILNEILKGANLNDDLEEDDKFKKIIANDDDDDGDDEGSTKKNYEIRNQFPHERFNALTCVMDDIFYIYGGIYESEEQECNLDSFYAVDLSKLDGVTVFWEDLSEVDNLKHDSEEDDDEEDDSEDDDENKETDQKLISEEEGEENEDDSEEEIDEAEKIPDDRPWLPHPKTFESLRNFYIRTGAEFLKWVIDQNRDSRGKDLKTKAFELAESRWWDRREAVRIEEDVLEENGVSEVIEKDLNIVNIKRR